MRILYIQPSSEIGGSDVALWRTLRELDKRRFTAVVVVPRPGPLTQLMQDCGAHVRVVPMQQLRPLPDPRYQFHYLLSFWLTVVRLVRVIHEERIDVVHTNSLYCLYGAWAALFTRRPHIWHVREIVSPRHPARPVLTAMAMLLSARVLAMSVPVAAMFSERARSSGRIAILGDGVDTIEYRPAIGGHRIRTELGIPSKTPLIGFVARLDPWKGLEVFLHAAALVSAHFPDARFLVSGDAPPGFESYADEMKALAQSLGLGDRVLFTGWRYRLRDIPELMAALDVFVHCALSPEPWGLVVLEAMAMGKPVVAAGAGGPAGMVLPGKTGWLGIPGDARSFADKICSLLQDPATASSMGKTGRERVLEHFALSDYVRRIETVYDQVCRKTKYSVDLRRQSEGQI